MSIKIVFIKNYYKNKIINDVEGTLYLRKIEGGKTFKKSLEIDLSQNQFDKFFNIKTQRFKKDRAFKNAEAFNERIENKLEELKMFNNDLEILPNNRKSLIQFWKDRIKTTKNHGSKIKHNVILDRLTRYLVSIGKNDLLFKDVTPSFVRELRIYLLNTKDPKSLSNNSVNHYLKVIKSIINHAQKEAHYLYIIHPFLSISFKNEKKVKGVITEWELSSIQETVIGDLDIDMARKMFLFQLFCNGLRVSDLLLMRWNNLHVGGRLKYRMFKTGELISIPINLNVAFILADLLGKKDRYKNLIDNLPISLYTDNKETKVTVIEIEERISKLAGRIENLSSLDLHKIQNNPDAIIIDGYFLSQKNHARFMELINSKEELLSLIEKVFIGSLMGFKDKMKQTDFIFDKLKNDEFDNIDFNNDFSSNITLKQYKMIRSATVFYNRRLKKVAELCNVETNLSSHVSRHSFTNLLLNMDNVNLYDISQSLGHKTITITQNYIQSGFNNKKIDYLNREMANRHRKKS